MWIVWETAHSTRQNTNSLQFVIVFHNEEMEGKHLMILALAVALPCSRVIDSHCCYKMPASITLKARIPTVNLFTPWSRVLLDKVTGSQLVKKYPAFYGTRRFITAFTSAHRLSILSPQHYDHDKWVTVTTTSGCGWRNSLQYGGYLRAYWISSCRQPTWDDAPYWRLGEVLTTPLHENVCCEPFAKALDPGLDPQHQHSWKQFLQRAVCGYLLSVLSKDI